MIIFLFSSLKENKFKRFPERLFYVKRLNFALTAENNIGHFASNLTMVLLKVLIPFYASYKSIESDDQYSHSFWLLYWVVSSLFSFIEIYILPVVCFLPFINQIRFLFYLWLQIPVFNGTYFILKNVINPFFSNNMPFLDVLFPQNITNISNSFNYVIEYIRNVYNNILLTFN